MNTYRQRANEDLCSKAALFQNPYRYCCAALRCSRIFLPTVARVCTLAQTFSLGQMLCVFFLVCQKQGEAEELRMLI